MMGEKASLADRDLVAEDCPLQEVQQDRDSSHHQSEQNFRVRKVLEWRNLGDDRSGELGEHVVSVAPATDWAPSRNKDWAAATDLMFDQSPPVVATRAHSANDCEWGCWRR